MYKDNDLVYAATSRCQCGAGKAHPKDADSNGCWDCSDILTGRAIPSNEQGAKIHTAQLPFTFYEVLSEDQPSAQGMTTRPKKINKEEK